MTTASRASLAGWGRYPVVDCIIAEPDHPAASSRAVSTLPSSIPRGNGRSYGDASLNPEGVILTRRLAHLLAFDEATGVLTCEAGALLSDILAAMLPRGWMAPVTPGTRFVTIGGMIAADVHGKNHHVAGSFCDHLLWLDLALPNGRVLRCSRLDAPDLFAATCGGMGLTGIILRACFPLARVETAQIAQRTIHAPTLDAVFDTFEAEQDATYSVAWVDGLASGKNLGRSVVFLGEHARVDELPAIERARPFDQARRAFKRMPIDLPPVAMSRVLVKTFNQVYYRTQRAGSKLADLYPYFYPLDALLDWNRIYGTRGFVQYQCVLPLDRSRKGIGRLLEEIGHAGQASFLATLKRMGPQSFGLLSFPMNGYTLAMDFPADPANLALLHRLDAITAEHGGRIYLAKDARAEPSVMAGYTGLAAFREVRQRYGLIGHVESVQSRRLEI